MDHPIVTWEATGRRQPTPAPPGGFRPPLSWRWIAAGVGAALVSSGALAGVELLLAR